MIRLRSSVGSLFALFALAACGGDDAPPPTPNVVQCERDPARLEASIRCVSDDTCPCGAFCDRGACAYECTSDADCAAGRCDAFGRCRADGDDAIVPAPPRLESARIRLGKTVLEPVEGSPAALRVTFTGAEPTTLRVATRDGALVECEPGAGFSDACELEEVSPGAEISLSVRRSEIEGPLGIGTVTVFGPSGAVSSASVIDGRGEDAPASPPLEPGVYRGEAVLVAIDGASPTVPTTLPLEAELWQGVLRVEDPYARLAPSGALIGAVDRGASTVAFPAGAWRVGEGFADMPTEVFTQAEVATLTAPDGAPVLRFERKLSFGGLVAGAAPEEVWSVYLERVDEPSGAAAPAVPPDFTPSVTAEARLEQATLPEQALGGAVGEPSASALAAAYGAASTTSLAVCAPAPAAWEEAARQVRAAWWAPSAGVGGTLADLSAGGGLPGLLADGLTAGGLGSDQGATLSVNRTDVTGLAARAIPCAVSFGVTTFDAGTCGDTTVTLAAYDECAAMEQAYGCAVSEVTSGSLSVEYTLELGGACATSGALTASGVPTRVCVLPQVPRGCAAAALCAEGASTSGLGAETLLGTGDATCAGTERAAALSVDLARAGGQPPTASEVFSTCRAALGAAAPGGDVDAIFGADACLEAYRVALAASAAARGASATEEARLLARVLGRHLELLTFLASEASERERIAAALRGTDDIPRPEEVLADIAGGLELLLHPVVAGAVFRLPADAVRAPDYRVALGSAQTPADAQVTLPVRMMEAATAITTLLDLRVERAALEADAAGLATISEIGPGLALLQHFAEALAARAPEAAWAPRYESAARRLLSVQRRLVLRVAGLKSGVNPLGIGQDDLPLYFFGDAVGSGGRFSAISDFLLGERPSDPAWAPFLVQRAQEALESARAQYAAQADRVYRAELSENQAQMRRVAVADEADGTLQELCGASDGSYVEDDGFSAASCFRAAACEPDVLTWYRDRVGVSNVAFQTCVSAQLKDVYGPAFGLRADLQGFFEGIDSPVTTGGACSAPVIQACDEGACLRCSDGRSIALGLDTLHMNTPALRASQGLEGVNDAVAAAVKRCADRWDATSLQGYLRTPRVSLDGRLPSPPDPPLDAVSCFRGAIGEAVLEIQGAQEDLEAARSEIAEARDVYEAEVNECARRFDTEQSILGSIESHRQLIDALTGTKLGADTTAEWAGQVKDCTATVSGLEGFGWQAGAAIGSCAAGAVEGAFNTVSLSLERDIELADRAFEQTLRALEAEADYQACLNDAARWLVGARTAAVGVKRAMTDVQSAYAQFQNLIELADDVWVEARATLADDLVDGVRPPTFDLWLDEAVTTYAARFRLARRAVYLAVLAVEYEYQATIPERGLALAAETPAELESVLQDLWASAGTRSIEGARPTDLKVVLSLRDQLLRIFDERVETVGERTLTAAQRFRMLLQDPRFARYEDGEYVGQLVPFGLAPLGTFGYDAGAVPVLAGSDCAERLWSVNASILGGEGLLEGSDSSFARIELWKQNVFFSQWCAPRDDEEFQVASVRPSRNLFREPGVGTDVGAELGGREPEAYSKARIEAYFGVERADLESEQYASGDTSELAARGLYGRYALFLPAEVLSRFENGSRTDGLVLDEVEDILLRLDYVSVAR